MGRKLASKLDDTICIVTWKDAASHDAWDETSAFLNKSGLVSCKTVGFLLERTSEEIKLLRTCHEDGNTGEGMFSIPIGMIVDVHMMKQRKRKQGPSPVL